MTLEHHIEAAKSFFQNFAHQPMSNLLTLGILAITLALPGGLYSLLNNAGRILSGWEDQAQVSLYLKDTVSAETAQALKQKIAQEPGVRQVKYLDKLAAVEEFKKLSGFAAGLEALEENPLPASLIIAIDPTRYSPSQIESLAKSWANNPEVEIAKYDLAWVARLQSMLALAQRTVTLLAGLLAIGVILIIGNTIRIHILSRREEIKVSKLVGASNRFVRLPFLYHGLLQGVLAGACAWAIIALTMLALHNPSANLASLYNSDFQLRALSFSEGSLLVLGSAILGWLGSWLALTRHLKTVA